MISRYGDLEMQAEAKYLAERLREDGMRADEFFSHAGLSEYERGLRNLKECIDDLIELMYSVIEAENMSVVYGPNPLDISALDIID